jgi:enoyl-CoA hydratase/carnithine racemase
MVTARRFGGQEAYARQLVDQAVSEAEVVQAAVALAHANVGKAGPTLETIKTRMYAPVLAALNEA